MDCFFNKRHFSFFSIFTKPFKGQFFLSSFFLLAALQLFSQKIDGVYYGEIISPKNAMVLKRNDKEVKGIIFLNEKDTIGFFASYSDATFRGTIRLNDRDIVIEGELERNAMWLKVLPDTVRRFLNKVSPKVNYKIAKLYQENLDPMLLGRWESIRQVNSDGTVVMKKGATAATYLDNNLMYLQVLSIPSGISQPAGISDSQIRFQKLEHSWETKGNELTRILTPPPPFPQVSEVCMYIIKQDTLKTYSRGMLVVFKKK